EVIGDKIAIAENRCYACAEIKPSICRLQPVSEMKVSEGIVDGVVVFIFIFLIPDGNQGGSGADLKKASVVLAKKIVQRDWKQDGTHIVYYLKSSHADLSAKPIHLVGKTGIKVKRGDTRPSQFGIHRLVCLAVTRIRSKAAYKDYKQGRSEEHTSALQSRENLVCLLLLVPPCQIHALFPYTTLYRSIVYYLKSSQADLSAKPIHLVGKTGIKVKRGDTRPSQFGIHRLVCLGVTRIRSKAAYKDYKQGQVECK